MRPAPRWVLLLAGAGYVFLHLPVLVLVLFSFNASRYSVGWTGFTLDWYRALAGRADLWRGLRASLIVGSLSTVVAAGLGTLIALALTRYRFRGSATVSLLLVLPLTTPEVVLGSSLLSLFLDLGVRTGFATIVVAHVMFSISYVALTVRARLRGFDWTLEEAAMDLGASPLRVFRTVTLPLIAPGVVAAALLAFVLSLDDFIITLFNAGSEVTYPLYVYGARRAAFPPQINVMATALLLASLLAAGAVTLYFRTAKVFASTESPLR